MAKTKKIETRILEIKNCKECPACDTERTLGAGCAEDYFCKNVPDPEADYKFKVIKGYVEWSSEEPQDGQFPKWCPLKKGKGK